MWQGSWPSLDIQNLERSLVEVERLVQQPSGQSDEVIRALSRFLVIRSCGYIEQVVEECLRAYLKSKSSPRVHAFGVSWLGYGANPSPGKLVTLVRRMDAEWATELDSLFNANDQTLSREISLLVERRNGIAHGQSDGMGAAKALTLTSSAKQVSDWFIRRFDPR